MVTIRSETKNQHGDVVQTLIAKLVVPRRAATVDRPAVRLSQGREDVARVR